MTLEEYRELLKSIEGVDFLTVEESAKLLRTSEGAICKAIHDGSLPTITLGERGQTWRVYRAHIPQLAALCGDEADRYDKPTKAERQARLPDPR